MEQKKCLPSRYHIDDIEKLDTNDSHRIILELLGDAGNVLDVGCSTGFLGRYLKTRNKKAVGIESDAIAASQAGPHYDRVIVGDMTSAQVLSQIDDGAFDAIVLGDVIEHLIDPWSAVKSVVNKLAEQGSLIVSIPHLGHGSIIAALLSETFQYHDVGLLDRTHYRFFSLQSLCALLVDASLTPVELKRVVHNTFGTEIQVTTDRLPAEIFPVLDRCPESRTYQFVMRAVKSPPIWPLSVYVDRFLLPIKPEAEKDLIVQSYLKELETCRREVREARDYISECTKIIKEKDEGIDYLKSTIEREQKEKERLLHSISVARRSLEEDAAIRAASLIEERLCDIRELLNHGMAESGPPPRCDTPYNILIPIYNAHDYVKMCVESVLVHTEPIHQVYLLDDASTDPRILPLLRSFSKRDHRVHVLISERNRGFIENVNRGLTLSRNPVVILNSDTQVTSEWIDRMHSCLHSGALAGIVCPLSNNATILSVPVINKSNKLPEKMTPNGFAKLVVECSRRVYRRIPTAVGFCMMISRKVLDQVGSFDTAFGLGYGEENDFCERAKLKGFEILCCDDAYVHHYGEASFSAVSQINSKRSQNMELLNKRWPQYREEVLSFCRSNPLRDVQERIYHAMKTEKIDGRPSVLHVIHNFNAPGGTEIHTRNIIDGLALQFKSTVIFPESQPTQWSDLSSDEPTAYLRIAKVVKENEKAQEFFLGYAADLSSKVIEENFARFVFGGDFALVHFQHLVDWDTLMLPFIAKDLGKKVVLTLHDYYLLCPEYNFLLPGSKHRCGKDRANGKDAECIYCLGSKRQSTMLKTPVRLPEYIEERFATIRCIFKIADAVIAPSTFVRNKFVDVFGSVLAEKCVVIGHGVETLKKCPRPQRTRKLRVGFLGNASDRKGIMVYLTAANLLKNAQIQFEIFGGIPVGLKKIMSELGVIVHGNYCRSELPKLLSKIDLVVVSSVWDETFCLTVSEAQAMGVPVLASDSGAIAERIREGRTGFLFPTGNAEALASRLFVLSADSHSLEPVIAGLDFHKGKTIEENISDYAQLYSRLTGTQPPTATEDAASTQEITGSAGKVSIVILTFNQLDYTKKCVESLRKHTPQSHEIVFVDNGSKDGTVVWLRALVKNNPNYKIIENVRNLGFATGCNQGIRAASGDCIVLLNNDVVATVGWLSGMMECIESAPDIGIVGPMTNNISGPQMVPDIGYSSIDDLENYAIGFREKNRYRKIPYRRVVGFCMLFKRRLVEDIGLLDESFGTGNFEDDDFCLRAALAGYRNLIAGDVFLHHYGSRSFIGNKIDYRSSITGNRKVFSSKWGRIDPRGQFGKKTLVITAIEQAEAFNRKGQIDDAVSSLVVAIKQVPDEKKLSFRLTEILLEAKRFNDANSILDALSSGEDSNRFALIGLCADGLEQFDKAETNAELALSHEPSNVLALNLKGTLAYRKGDKDAAERFFKTAVDIDPSFGDSYTNLGVMKWDAGKHAEAIDLFEHGFILSPTTQDVAAAYHMATVESKTFERAERVFKEASALYQDDRKIAFLLIALLVQLEKYSEAMLEIERALGKFGIDDGLLSAALNIRERIRPVEVRKNSDSGATLSLCMIAKNEEEHIARCILSVKSLVDEIIVVDTGSTDRTKEIAKILGAKVFEFPWTSDFSDARNYSISKANGNWVFILDADENLSTIDHEAIRRLISKHGRKRTAFRLTTRNYTNEPGTKGWLENDGKYSNQEAGKGWFPSEKVRIYKNDPSIKFVNPVHEIVEPSMRQVGFKIMDCDVPIHHYGKLSKTKVIEKGRQYYRLGLQKIEEMQGDYNALRELAVQASEIGEYDDAVNIWQKAIDLRPKDANACMNAGYAYLKLKQYDNAMEYSRKAMEIDPESREAALNYSAAELIAGDARNAVSLLEKLLKMHPDYPPALGWLAAGCIVEERKNEGFEYLDRLEQKGFDCAGTLEEQAQDFIGIGKIEQATALLEAAQEKGISNGNIPQLLNECQKKMARKPKIDEKCNASYIRPFNSAGAKTLHPTI